MIINEVHWTSQTSVPLLGLLQLLPLLAMIAAVWLQKHRSFMTFGLIASVIELCLAILVYHQFDQSQPGMQLAEQVTIWAPLNYHAAVDGMSVLFILLTAVLTTMVFIYCTIIPVENPKLLPVILLAIEATLMSLFTTVDFLWFTIMTFAEILLVVQMVRRWSSSPERDLAMTRYFQFMLSSFLLLVIGVGFLGWNYVHVTDGSLTFDLILLAKTAVDSNIGSIIFFLLFYSFAIRIPLFPLHGWLPLVAEHGTVAMAPVILLGLKVALYALLRFVLPILPDAVIQWHEFVVAFAVVGVFYAAIMAMMQVNLRRLLSFAVVSHTGILIIGLFSLNKLAFEGSVLLSINFGLAISGLLFMTGLVFLRTRTMLLKKLGGLFDYIPYIGVAFFISGLSIVGMPGTPGFDAAHLILEASIHRFGALVTIAAALGNVVAAGFLLWAFQRAFLSPKIGTWDKHAMQTNSGREKFLAGTIIVILMISGFHSQPWIDLVSNSMLGLDNLYSHIR